MIDQHHLKERTAEFELGPKKETTLTGYLFIYVTFSTKIEGDVS